MEINGNHKAPPTYYIATLGCEKNSVDSEGMGSLLSEAGYAPADADSADVLIVNTCGFLHASTDQSVGVLRDLDQARRPGQLLIAAGCAAHRYGDELKDRVDGHRRPAAARASGPRSSRWSSTCGRAAP